MAEPTPTPMSEKLTDKIWELHDEIKRLKAALATAREEEKEACALVADTIAAHADGRAKELDAPQGGGTDLSIRWHMGRGDAATEIAAAIRARSRP